MLLTCSVNDKVLSMIIPKFLAFVFISIVVFANIKVSCNDGYSSNPDVKCILVFPGLLFNMFLVFPANTSSIHARRTSSGSTECLDPRRCKFRCSRYRTYTGDCGYE